MGETVPPENVALHRFAVATAVATLGLIVAGGLVTSTESGLSVPDWPLSYGRLMPPMVGGVFYEHGHRMVATTVGILTVVLAIWLARREPRRWVRRLGLLAVAAVVAQGVLGGLTVIFLLPTAVSRGERGRHRREHEPRNGERPGAMGKSDRDRKGVERRDDPAERQREVGNREPGLRVSHDSADCELQKDGEGGPRRESGKPF